MTELSKRRGPIVEELEDDIPNPAEAPPVPDDALVPLTPVTIAAEFAARPKSPVLGWIWRIGVALLGFVISLAAWNYVTGLLASHPILGMIAGGLIALFVLVLLIAAFREMLALLQLRKVDRVQALAVQALLDQDLPKATKVVGQLRKLYAGRKDTQWGLSRMADLQDGVFDADGLLGVAETTVLAPLDTAAQKQVEQAARQVATVTALVPLALVDVVTALATNLRMIRSIAEIYGGRGGVLGSWRLAKAVLSHLVATGAVALGDDLIGSLAGGSVLSKLSRRFGEGLVNGALTARVGVAAMEVCRPLPFTATKRPSVSGILGRALTGVFGKGA